MSVIMLDSYENGQAECKYKGFIYMANLSLWIFRK